MDADLDLVEIVPNADPPVCRVMDYGKFKFEQSKKAQIAKKKQKLIHVKEIKFRPGTEASDYQIKIRKIVEFLTAGDKTKVTVRFRGRELMHQERGSKLLDRIEGDLKDHGEVEQRPKLEGRQLVMVFTPLRKNQLKINRNSWTKQMPKLKTNRGAAKRFKKTASGGFKRIQSHGRHILTKKSTKRKRQLRASTLIADADNKAVERMLPYV